MKKKISITTTICAVIISITVTFVATFSFFSIKFTKVNEMLNNSNELIGTLMGVDELVKQNFVGEFDEKNLLDGMLTGYIAGLGDPHSSYLTKEEYDSVMQNTKGEFEGIGINVDPTDFKKGLFIIYVMPNSPAEKAGLLASDIITKVNDKEAIILGYEGTMTEILGAVDTTVKLTILRNDKEIEFNVQRSVFEKIPVTPLKIINDNIGFIRITEFEGKVAELLKKEVDRAYELNLKGLIFDVRNNPGGELEAIAKCLDNLMPKGNLITIKFKTGLLDNNNKPLEPKVYTTEGQNELRIPAVVLVNENTASAAELFASDMKDANKAVLVGKKTYGKQVGQSIFPLKNGSAVKITTFNYLARNEENFNKVGITPNEVVNMDKNKTQRLFSLPPEQDDQLKKAIQILTEKIA
ncbi:MAG: S41 family peptidase [Clostridia bacterium]